MADLDGDNAQHAPHEMTAGLADEESSPSVARSVASSSPPDVPRKLGPAVMSTQWMARIRTVFSKPMVLVGSVTAVFSLIAGVSGGWNFISSRLEEHHAVDRLLASAAVQLDAFDYPGAWRTLEQASAIDSTSARVQQVQEDVAMRWLEDIQVSGKQTFTEITEKLKPVLTRGVTSTKSSERQSDLLAHLGWLYFLQGRESPSWGDPELLYREALKKDPANPYAHAMLGHWILWNGGGSAEANAHFTTALASRPDARSFVRVLQLSQRIEGSSVQDSEEAIKIANAVRKEHGELRPDEPKSILNIYYFRMIPPDKETPVFLNAVPPTENLATFDWLAAKAALDSDDLNWPYLRNALLEATGHRKEALAEYRALAKQLERRDGAPSLLTATKDAILRLTPAAIGSHS
jgi:tetratricopeptide (TPR) repeat protein